MTKVVIDPITRIEGHLRVTCMVENGVVTEAWNHATLFRGFEVILKGRDPRDAWHFAQRICGVCPTPHAHNSVTASERAMGVAKVVDNVRLVRNMMDAAQIGYDSILWFYILNAFDYVDVVAALKADPATPQLKAVQDQVRAVVESGQLGPFANGYWGHPAYRLPPELDLELTAHYLQSIEVQAKANQAAAYLGGKFPMIMNYATGGLTQLPSLDEILFYRARMDEVRTFVDTVMLPDLLAIAPYHLDLALSGTGTGNYLTWGVLEGKSQDPKDRLLPAGGIAGGKLEVFDVDPEKVRIYSKYSYYPDSVGGGKHPLDSGQEPVDFTGLDPASNTGPVQGKYDWTRAARYDRDGVDLAMEVGPLAEILVAYLRGRKEVVTLVDTVLAAVGSAGKPQVLLSNLGRIAARVVKAKVNADAAVGWADELTANIKGGDTRCYTEPPHPDAGTGTSAWDAPRGALSHYVKVSNGRIERYAAVPASNWNLSPRDDRGVRGALEEALVGTQVADTEKPLEILRVVHTFDP